MDEWTPSRYVVRDGRLRATRDRSLLSPGSWLHVDGVARAYDAHARAHLRGALIDLGCGRVPLYGLYGPLVDEVTCVDWERSRHGNDHVDVVCSLDEALPFGDATFDTVLLSDVAEHLPRPQATAAEIARILRPGGTLVMNTPFLYPLHEEPWDFQRLTRHGLDRLAAAAGLERVVLVETGGAHEAIADMMAKMTMAAPLIGPAVAMGIQRVARAFSRLVFATGPGRRARGLWPTGYLMVARKPTG